MPKRRDIKAPEKIDINMTPMIDVVFQLMAFFLMTFKVASVEGDFNMKLPKDERSAGPANTQVEMIDVVMKARPDGDLAFVGVAGLPPFGGAQGGFLKLTEYVAIKVSAAKAAGQDEPEIQIDADDMLRYENIISAVSAVSSHYDANGQVAPLAKKVKFKPKE